MKLCFFTDPHLGARRQAHTTSRSQAALQAHLFEVCNEIAERAAEEKATLFCLGDLVDKHSNKEAIVAQALRVAMRCDYTLAGNHDSKNLLGAVGSLDLVKEALGNMPNAGQVIKAPGDDPYFISIRVGEEGSNAGKVVLHFIPHAYTQELFEESVRLLCERQKLPETVDAYDILCLHCNVGETHGKVEDEGTTLALTPALQKLVATHFDRVLVGHEHERREVGRRILVLGNTYPLSFGEISDRFITWFDTLTHEWVSERIFDAKAAYQELEASLLMELDGDFDTSAQLVCITGKVRIEDYPRLTRALSKFWQLNEATLFGVRNNVEVERAERLRERARSSGNRTLPQVVRESVADTDFGIEFAELEFDTDD